MAPTPDTRPESPEAKRRKRGRGADPGQTKDELVAAAMASLVEEGYSGTTARSIAARAHCNQAAIYYHFGGMEPLLIEALHRSSTQRLERYKASLDDHVALSELVEQLEVLYQEDSESGHFALLAEMLGGITATPELRAGIEEATQPWVDFVEERVRHATSSLPFGAMLPARDLADLVFSVVVGVELRNKVDGNVERADRLFRLGRVVAALVEAQTD